MLTTVEFMAARVAAARRSERGSAIVEYSLLLALIAVVCIGAVQKFGLEVSNMFQTVTDAL